MNKTRLLVAMIVLSFTTVAFAKVTVDFDQNADFSKYRTYAWQKGTPAADPLNQRRIERAVSEQLKATGLSEASASPDLNVVTHASSKQKKEVHTGNFGYGPMSPGFGEQEFTMTIDIGTLRVDLVDARTKKLVWSATATKTLSDDPKKVAKLIEKVVTQMFKRFPPKQ